MKYAIVESWDPAEVTKDVNLLLTEGWQLIGGVSISHEPGDGASTLYAQAMFHPTLPPD